MNLVDIVRTKPKPWWPEGLTYDGDARKWCLDTPYENLVFVTDTHARMLFTGAAFEWLAQHEYEFTHRTECLDKGGGSTLIAPRADGRVSIHKAPCPLSALVAAIE